MTEPASPKYPFPGDIDRNNLRTEQQLDPLINREMLVPNPLDPIGNIETEGRAFRTLSSGRMPLWILLLSWATIGAMAFGLIGLFLHGLTNSLQTAITTQQYDQFWVALVSLLPGLLIPGLMLIVLFRATWRSR